MRLKLEAGDLGHNPGTVIDVEGAGVRVQWDVISGIPGAVDWHLACNLEPEWRGGMRVRHRAGGHLGTVVEWTRTNGEPVLFVHWDDGAENWFAANDLEPRLDGLRDVARKMVAHEAPRASLKPGDRVIVQNVPRSDFSDAIPAEWAASTPAGSVIFPEPARAQVVQVGAFGGATVRHRGSSVVRIELEGGWRCWVPIDCLKFDTRAPEPYEPPAVTREGTTVLPAAALRAALNLRQAVQQLAIAYEMAEAAERSELAAIGLMSTLEETRRLAGRLERLAIDCGEPDSADSIATAECLTCMGADQPVRDRLRCAERRGRFARFVLSTSEHGEQLSIWFDLETETALLLERDTRLVNVEPIR